MNRIKILRIVSTILVIPAVVTFILWSTGKLDAEIMAIINWIVFLGEFIILLYVMKVMRFGQTNVVIPKGSCEEKTIVAETHIFPKFLKPTNTYKNCIFRVCIQIKEFKRYPLFYIIRKYKKDTCIQELNSKIKLDPGLTHIFEMIIDSQEELNFKFNEDVTIHKLVVEELYIA